MPVMAIPASAHMEESQRGTGEPASEARESNPRNRRSGSWTTSSPSALLPSARVRHHPEPTSRWRLRSRCLTACSRSRETSARVRRVAEVSRLRLRSTSHRTRPTPGRTPVTFARPTDRRTRSRSLIRSPRSRCATAERRQVLPRRSRPIAWLFPRKRPSGEVTSRKWV